MDEARNLKKKCEHRRPNQQQNKRYLSNVTGFMERAAGWHLVRDDATRYTRLHVRVDLYIRVKYFTLRA